jgi:hypothetical protein
LKQITEPRAPQVRRIWTCEFTLGLEGLGEHRFTQFPSEVAVLGSTASGVWVDATVEAVDVHDSGAQCGGQLLGSGRMPTGESQWNCCSPRLAYEMTLEIAKQAPSRCASH